MTALRVCARLCVRACARGAISLGIAVAIGVASVVVRPAADGAPTACAASAADEPDARRVESVHYVLTSEGPEEETHELSRVLEAAWPLFEGFFGAAPKLTKGERLRVRFFESPAAMKRAIVAAGGVAPDAGGYYCPVARTAYAWRQPSRWYTRTLVLHEAAHQFHLLGAGAGAGTKAPASWWQEGLAEHVSSHTWDGRTLKLAVVPPVSLEDRSGAARASAGAPGFDVESIVAGPVDRPLAMHLVRYLATSDDGKPVAAWKDLRRSLDRGVTVKPREVWKVHGTAAQFRERFASWTAKVLQPFVVEFVEWDSLDLDAVRGRGAVVSICRTRASATSIEATMEPADAAKPWRAGLLLAWRGPDDYVIGQILSGASVRVDRRLAGAWTTLHEGPLPEGAAAPWKLAAERRGGDVALRIGGVDAAVVEVPPGPLGLCVDACEADFRAVRIR